MIRLPYKMPLAIGVRLSAGGMVDVPQSPAIIEPIPHLPLEDRGVRKIFYTPLRSQIAATHSPE
jgi:hypothetical protein